MTIFQVVITKRLLSQLYGQTDAALANLSSSLLARQAGLIIFSCFFLSPLFTNILGLSCFFSLSIFLHFAKSVDLLYFASNIAIPRKATLCKELLQTVAKVDSGFSQFRFGNILKHIKRLYFQGPHNLGAVPSHQSIQPNPS